MIRNFKEKIKETILNSLLDPLLLRRVKKFRRIRRSFYSLILIAILFILSLFAEVIANHKPLVMSYNGKIYFPAFKVYQAREFTENSDFGGMVEPDYKSLEVEVAKSGWLIKPLIYWGENESNTNLERYPSPPSGTNLLGTDDRGRDVLARLIYGLRISLIFALVTLLFSMVAGTLIGGVQGFFGGKFDLIGQRLVEIWVSLPYIFMVILIINIFEPSLWLLIFILAAFSWMPASYYMRAECLRLKKQEFAIAAESLGATRWQVFFSHILPNAMTPLITLAPFVMSLAISALSFLDYMGLGVQAPTASIGELLRQGRNNFLNAWWLALFPFLTLVSILILINFVGEGVRKAFDPRASVVD